MGDAVYDRSGSDLHSRGLYLDVPPWQSSVFSLKRGLEVCRFSLTPLA